MPVVRQRGENIDFDGSCCLRPRRALISCLIIRPRASRQARRGREINIQAKVHIWPQPIHWLALQRFQTSVCDALVTLLFQGQQCANALQVSL